MLISQADSSEFDSKGRTKLEFSLIHKAVVLQSRHEGLFDANRRYK